MDHKENGRRSEVSGNRDFQIVADCIPGATAKFREQFAAIQKEDAKHFGNGKDQVPVRTVSQYLFAMNSAHRTERLAEQEGQKPRRLQEKANRYSCLQESQCARAKLAIMFFETQIILAGKSIEMMEENRVESSSLGTALTVDL